MNGQCDGCAQYDERIGCKGFRDFGSHDIAMLAVGVCKYRVDEDDRRLMDKYDGINMYNVIMRDGVLTIENNGYYYDMGKDCMEWRDVQFDGCYIPIEDLFKDSAEKDVYQSYDADAEMTVYPMDVCEILTIFNSWENGFEFKDPKTLTEEDVGKTYLWRLF